MKDKVAIFAGGPTRVLGAEAGASGEFDIWSIPYVNGELTKKATCLFEMHDREVFSHYIDKLRAVAAPLYMHERQPDIPESVRYPIEEIVSEYGDYFTNTVSYMVALAIYKEYKEIHLFGVEMMIDSEYAHQKPSCEYYLGIARGRGIKVVVPDESPILKSRVRYGTAKNKDEELAAGRLKILEKVNNDLKDKVKEIQSQIRYYEGCIDDCKFFLNKFR